MPACKTFMRRFVTYPDAAFRASPSAKHPDRIWALPGDARPTAASSTRPGCLRATRARAATERGIPPRLAAPLRSPSPDLPLRSIRSAVGGRRQHYGRPAVASETADAAARGEAVRDVVVVGAGPAGTAAAMLLSKQGYSVQVFERRGDPSTEAASKSRGFGIAVNPRGQHALKQLGISLPSDDCGVKFEGSLRHSSKGTSMTPNSDGVVCVDRGALARHMVMHAQAEFPDINFRFHMTCKAVDLVGRTVWFQTTSGQDLCVKYDLLVAADGANSAVREALAAAGAITYTREENKRDYKSFLLDQQLWASEPEYHNKMLTWQSVDGSVTRMWAVPNPDGTAQGMLTLYKGAFDGLQQPEDYARLLASKFAGVKDSMRHAIAERCAEAPVSGGGTMVKCSKLYSDRVVLVGDAGHSMFPALGQGCNSAIESAAALVESIRRADSVEAALEAYSDDRLPETSAAADMSAMVLDIDGSAGPVGSFKKAIFAMQIILGMLSSKIAPKLFKPPVMFQVNKVGASYVQLRQRMKRESFLIAAALLLLAGLIVQGVVQAAMTAAKAAASLI
eukprot:jgi/Tetstr1/454522/TSEL_041420.t1